MGVELSSFPQSRIIGFWGLQSTPALADEISDQAVQARANMANIL
jgi:hypothetical protein